MSTQTIAGGLRLVSLATLAIAVGVGAATQPALATVLVLAPLALAAAAFPAPWLVLLGLPLLLWPLLWASGGQDTRPALVVLAALLLVRIAVGHDERNVLRSRTGWRVTVLGLVAMASTVWSVDRVESAAAGAALLAVGVLLTAVTPDNVSYMERLLVRAAAAFLVLNLVVAVTPLGVLAGRTRGVFANPNSLAVFIVLVLPLLFAHRRYRPLVLVGLGLLVGTGSRSGVLAVLAEAVVALALLNRHRVVQPRILAGALLIGLAAVAVRVLASSTVSDSSVGSAGYVLRSGDSRTALWTQAVQAWLQRPGLGFGAGAYPADTANSYLKLLTDLGVLGVLAALPLLALQARQFWSGRPQQAALVSGAVVSAFFESWMFAAGSTFFLLYWMQVGYNRDPVHR